MIGLAWFAGRILASCEVESPDRFVIGDPTQRLYQISPTLKIVKLQMQASIPHTS
jgi:hypothetical protein